MDYIPTANRRHRRAEYRTKRTTVANGGYPPGGVYNGANTSKVDMGSENLTNGKYANYREIEDGYSKYKTIMINN